MKVHVLLFGYSIIGNSRKFLVLTSVPNYRKHEGKVERRRDVYHGKKIQGQKTRYFINIAFVDRVTGFQQYLEMDKRYFRFGKWTLLALACNVCFQY